MINRIDTLSHLIEKYTPDIFSIQETNVRTADDLEDYQIKEYDLLIDKIY